MDQKVESGQCYALGIGFGYLTYQLIRKNRQSFAIVTCAILTFVSFLCSFSWFQGIFTTLLISTVRHYGEQLTEFQQTIVQMRGDLTGQQNKIKQHQEELQSVQAKIRTNQVEITDAQSNITNQYHKLFLVQEQLASAQTNLDQQQKKIEDVEYLAKNLFSKMTSETFSAVDSNRVVLLYNTNNAAQLLIKLDSVPIPGSLQFMTEVPTLIGRSQQVFPLNKIETFKNILFARLSGYDLPKTSLVFQYAKDTRETNLVQKIGTVGGKAIFDGQVFDITITN